MLNLLKRRIQSTNIWDKAGVALSGICMVHCLITPLVLATLPSLNLFVSNHVFHFVMAVILIAVASYAFALGYKKHKKLGVLIMGALGLAMLLVALNLTSHQHEAISTQSLVLNLIGSFLLVVAHIQNISACRQCDSHRH